MILRVGVNSNMISIKQRYLCGKYQGNIRDHLKVRLLLYKVQRFHKFSEEMKSLADVSVKMSAGYVAINV